MQTQQHNNEDDNYFAIRRVIRDTTPDRMRPALRRQERNRVRAAAAIAVAVALVVIGAAVGRAIAADTALDHDPVFERKVTDCADYIGTVNFRLQDGRAYEVARLIVTASKEAGNGWGWELLAAIARYETGGKFNVDARNKRTGCYGLLQIHPCHAKDMASRSLRFGDGYDTVLYGAQLLANSAVQGKSLNEALRPWAVRTAALKEYENIKELYRR